MPLLFPIMPISVHYGKYCGPATSSRPRLSSEPISYIRASHYSLSYPSLLSLLPQSHASNRVLLIGLVFQAVVACP